MLKVKELVCSYEFVGKINIVIMDYYSDEVLFEHDVEEERHPDTGGYAHPSWTIPNDLWNSEVACWYADNKTEHLMPNNPWGYLFIQIKPYTI